MDPAILAIMAKLDPGAVADQKSQTPVKKEEKQLPPQTFEEFLKAEHIVSTNH